MTSRSAFAAVLIGALGSVHVLAAEPLATPPCGHSLESAPRTVQATLAPAYADSAKVDLQAVAQQMSVLMLEIGHCQAMSQDRDNHSADRNHDIAEWQSLNQWLYRLTNFVDQNAHGDHHMDWKREFDMFVELYELKP